MSQVSTYTTCESHRLDGVIWQVLTQTEYVLAERWRGCGRCREWPEANPGPMPVLCQWKQQALQLCCVWPLSLCICCLTSPHLQQGCCSEVANLYQFRAIWCDGGLATPVHALWQRQQQALQLCCVWPLSLCLAAPDLQQSAICGRQAR